MIVNSSLNLFFTLTILLVLAPTFSSAESATLTLDHLSFLSLQDNQTFSLPAGSTIEFDFGAPTSDGALPFTISPSGVAINPIPIPGLSNASLEYSLASAATGSIRPASGGRIISFSATISATITSDAGTTTKSYPMLMTTENTTATSLSDGATLDIEGLRLVEGAWYAQIVGATTNDSEAILEPGAAVYTVLSGQFDSLPVGN